MSQKLYTESDIQAIADAIRYKNGSSDTYRVSDMSGAIRDIPSGGSGLQIKTIEWDGTGLNLINDIEIPLSDIHCMVLGIKAVEIATGDLNQYQGGFFWWGGYNSGNYYAVPYLNIDPRQYVPIAEFIQPNVLRLSISNGQSTSQNFNELGYHYIMSYIVLPDYT